LKSREMAEKSVEILKDKKAIDIEVLDITGISSMADYFVICSGGSVTHIKTLSDELKEKMTEAGYNSPRIEGYNSARWILQDYGDIVVHIFHQEDREFYDLERLWSDGKLTLEQ
jgi:ribosome-associated protein